MPRHRTQTQPDDPLASPTVRERIVGGARKHFFAHGFRGVTMDDLAAELGMSKKTLYAHFRSKPELVEAVLLGKAAEVEADLGRIEAECSDDFPEALREMLGCFQRHAQEIQPTFVRDMRQ